MQLCCSIHFQGTYPARLKVFPTSRIRLLLKTVLPLRVLDGEIIIELIDWFQQRNHRSYLSHRKKLLEKVDAEHYVAL